MHHLMWYRTITQIDYKVINIITCWCNNVDKYRKKRDNPNLKVSDWCCRKCIATTNFIYYPDVAWASATTLVLTWKFRIMVLPDKENVSSWKQYAFNSLEYNMISYKYNVHIKIVKICNRKLFWIPVKAVKIVQ